MLDLYDPDDMGREQLKVILKKSLARLRVLRQQRRDIDEVIMELQDNCGQIRDILAGNNASQVPDP